MKIFISSPGDVDKERRIAERLLDRLKQEFAGRLTIEPYFWEWEPMRLGKNFQAQIPATSLFDLVVCVVWSRIGTPVKAPDGREFPSGTEYEVVSAREAKAVGNKPDVLIYRNLTPAQLRQAPESEYQEHLRQLAALRAFVAKYCVDPKTGVIEGAFTTYQDLGDFELRLEKHLRKLIEEQLPKDGTTPLPEPSWPGSPFRGLEAFDFDHAPIFFGRTRAVGDVLALLRKRMTDVEDARALNPGGAAIKPAAFVLVSAMSGVGKSSLVRAGVLPLLVQPGDGVALWRRAVMRPGEAAASLFDGLAKALVRADALPELVSGEATPESIGALLRGNPAGIEFGLTAALGHASDLLRQGEIRELRQWQQECTQQGRVHDAERAARQLEELEQAKKPARLVLVVDQLEELFTLDTITAAEREGFVVALAALARSGKVYVIATLRSDFFARCAEVPLLIELSRQEGLYQLIPPTPQEIGQLIRQPAQAGGLRFELHPQTGQDLAERIRDASVGNPEALPLLEFCLEELYQAQAKRRDRCLRHADYDAMGGLAGALRQRAEAVHASLKPPEQASFGEVMRAVTTVALDKTGVFNRRWADYEELVKSAGARGFVEAFLAPGARLFVADQTDDGRKVVSVAHEALLSAWGKLKDWLEANREYLQIRATLAGEAKRWRDSDRRTDYLCHPGLPLEKAKQVQTAGFLNREENEYVAASVAQAEAETRRRTTRLRRLIALFSFLTVVAAAAGLAAWHVNKENIAQRAADDVQEARLVWLAAAKQAVRAGSYPKAAFYAARALGFRGYGWEQLAPDRKAALDHAYPRLLEPLFDPAQKANADLVRDLQTQLRLSTDRYLPIWCSPYSSKPHGGPVNCLAYSPDGSVLASGSDDTTIRLWDVAGGGLGATLMGHQQSIRTLRWSRDGKTLASGSDDATIKLWDAATGACTATWTGHTGPVLDLDWSRDGKTIASASRDGSVRLWDVGQGKSAPPLTGNGGAVTSVAFSPDGKTLASAGDGPAIRFWDVASGRPKVISAAVAKVTSLAWSPNGSTLAAAGEDQKIHLLDAGTGAAVSDPWTAATARIESVRWSPDGQTLASAGDDHAARLWDTSGKPLATLVEHTQQVMSLAWSPKDQTLATGGADREIKFWNGATGQRVKAPSGHSGWVADVAWSPDGRTVASGSWDSTVCLWDVSTGTCRATLRGHLGYIRAVAWSFDSRLIASASDDGKIKIWDAASGLCLENFDHPGAVTGLAWSRDERTIAGAGDDGKVRLWERGSPDARVMPTPSDEVILCVAFSPDGKILAGAGKGRTVRRWDAASGEELPPLPRLHFDDITRVCWSPDGLRLASCSTDQTIRIWNPQTGQAEALLAGHTNFVEALAWSPDGQTLASAGRDRTIKLWDAVSHECEATLSGHTEAIYALSWSPDCQSLASGGSDETVRFWDVGPYPSRALQPSHEDAVLAAQWGPGGKLLATASADQTIKLWDGATGECVGTMKADPDPSTIQCVAWSPDGLTLASGDWRNAVRLWDVATRQCVATLPPGHSAPVMSVCWSPDGKLVASGSKDNTVRIWDATTHQPVGAPLTGHVETVESVSWARNPAYPEGVLASGSWDHTIKLWDVAGRRCVQTLTGPMDTVWSVSWSPDGKTLASGDGGNAVRLWEPDPSKPEQYQCTHAWIEHTDQVASVAWSPDGKRVVSGSWDHTAKVWDVGLDQCVATLTGPTDDVFAVTWNPNPSTMAGASRDHEVRLWDMAAIRTRPVNLVYYLDQDWYRFNPGAADIRPHQRGAPDDFPINLYASQGMPWTNLNPRSSQTIGPLSPAGP